MLLVYTQTESLFLHFIYLKFVLRSTGRTSDRLPMERVYDQMMQINKIDLNFLFGSLPRIHSKEETLRHARHGNFITKNCIKSKYLQDKYHAKTISFWNCSSTDVSVCVRDWGNSIHLKRVKPKSVCQATAKNIYNYSPYRIVCIIVVWVCRCVLMQILDFENWLQTSKSVVQWFYYMDLRALTRQCYSSWQLHKFHDKYPTTNVFASVYMNSR